MVRAVEPGALLPGALRPRAIVQGVMGRAANHRGDGAGGAPPQGDRRLVGARSDRGCGALSFCKRLTQPIQERVHPAFEYWGHRDPTRGHEHKVPRDEIANRVAHIMAGQIRDKGYPKAHCLKRPTDAVSLLELC